MIETNVWWSVGGYLHRVELTVYHKLKCQFWANENFNQEVRNTNKQLVVMVSLLWQVNGLRKQ